MENPGQFRVEINTQVSRYIEPPAGTPIQRESSLEAKTVALEGFQKFFFRMDIDMSNKLPPFLAEKVRQMPESSYGANRVRVALKNGKKYSPVFIAWGEEIIKVGVSTQIPFEAENVVEVENDL